MTKLKLLRLKNAMLLANFISNVIGVSVVFFLAHRIDPIGYPEIAELVHRTNMIFVPAAFLLPIIVTLIYEKPIRRYLNSTYGEVPVSQKFTIRVHQRLLNEPFFLIAVDLVIWFVAALLYPALFWKFGADKATIHGAFFLNLQTGLITSTVAFFVFEHVLQKRVVSYFFPNGGLYMTPRTIRIRIRTRLIALLFACNLVPFIAFLTLIQGTYYSDLAPALMLGQLRPAIIANALIFMAVGIWLTMLVSSNLTRPLQEIIRVLRGVRNGDFDKLVRVTSNDEIGYTGDVINEMNGGLREREFIKETFGKYVAQEVRDEVLSGRIPLDGEMKEVTVLFADLRDFTPMTESHDPKFVVKIMNRYFEKMSDAIQQEGGLILQFLGDEIYAVFGAPISQTDHPERAFKAGLAMNQRLAELNEGFSKQGWPALRHGIGIHTGDAIAANIGSPDRLSYLLVGDTVNLASRLQGLTKELGSDIIISQATRSRLGDDLPLKALPATRIKGKSQPVEIFALT
jgi:adenylate cyclase